MAAVGTPGPVIPAAALAGLVAFDFAFLSLAVIVDAVVWVSWPIAPLVFLNAPVVVLVGFWLPVVVVLGEEDVELPGDDELDGVVDGGGDLLVVVGLLGVGVVVVVDGAVVVAVAEGVVAVEVWQLAVTL
ncbi:MAG: hypothetical protein JO244_12935 [Solirubrobacterales bacterium]|nr:hypothetical protein [Solirubrobacterales bacterium]